jgi:hypothetical protein
MIDFVDGLFASAWMIRFAVRLHGLRVVPRALRAVWRMRAFLFGPLDWPRRES